MKHLFRVLLVMSFVLFYNFSLHAQKEVAKKVELGGDSFSSSCCLPCKGNLIRNGDFTHGDGLLTSDMTNTTFTDWQRAFGTPNGNLVSPGYLDNGRINMWGNHLVGEGIKQQLTTPIKAGRSYRVSFAVKANQVKKRPDYLRYKMCAANGATNYSCTSGTVSLVGTSPDIYVVEGWEYVMLPIWTANNDYTHIYITPDNNSSANDGEQTSAGLIDNICVQKVRIKRWPSGDRPIEK